MELLKYWRKNWRQTTRVNSCQTYKMEHAPSFVRYLYEIAEKLSWWLVFSYCSFIFINASICTLLSSTKERTGLVVVINDFTYKVSTYLGKSKIIFSIVFLYGLISFYSIESQTFQVLTLFWGIYIVIWPLGLPELIGKVIKRPKKVDFVGEVISIAHPNILRAILKPNQSWKYNSIKIHVGPDHDRRYIILHIPAISDTRSR